MRAEHPSRPTSTLVWARAAVLGLVVLTSGAVSHVAADGLLPHPSVLALLLAASTGAAALFLRSRASAVRLVALVVGGQTLTHLVLSGTAGHAGAIPTAGAAASAGGSPALQVAAESGGRRVGSLADHFEAASAAGGRAAEVVPTGVPTGGWGAAANHLVEHAVAQGPLMLLAHALGAVALGLWLAVGETALWHLVGLAGVRVRIALVVACAPLRVRVSVLGALDAARRLLVPLPVRLPLPDTLPHRLVARRGPPTLLAA